MAKKPKKRPAAQRDYFQYDGPHHVRKPTKSEMKAARRLLKKIKVS